MSKSEEATQIESNQVKSDDHEHSIADYLQSNPDFFERHQDALLNIKLAHPSEDQVISLMDRQVIALREKNDALNKQFVQIIDNAKENQSLGERFHDITVSLLSLSDITELNTVFANKLKQDFDVQFAKSKIGDNNPLDSLFCPPNNKTYQYFVDRLSPNLCLCDNRLPQDKLEFLFDDDAAQVKSCALIPIVSARGIDGILALGSTDASRFTLDMATSYLDRLGQLLGTFVSRCNAATS